MDKRNNRPVLSKIIMRLFFSLILIGLSMTSSLAQPGLIAEKYLRIKPAVSTRDDVEKLLGKSDPKEHTVLYKNTDMTIRIEYSDGVCDPADEKWGLSEWMVEEIFYVPQTEWLRLRDVILDLSKFKKRQIGDVLDHITYYNNENGISVVYDKTEKTVASMTISPTLEQKKRFACGK